MLGSEAFKGRVFERLSDLGGEIPLYSSLLRFVGDGGKELGEN